MHLLRRYWARQAPVESRTRITPMTDEFDPGYHQEPYTSLCRKYPGQTVYPRQDFRLEGGRCSIAAGSMARPASSSSSSDKTPPRTRSSPGGSSWGGRPARAGVPPQTRRRPELRDGQRFPLQPPRPDDGHPGGVERRRAAVPGQRLVTMDKSVALRLPIRRYSFRITS